MFRDAYHPRNHLRMFFGNIKDFELSQHSNGNLYQVWVCMIFFNLFLDVDKSQKYSYLSTVYHNFLPKPCLQCFLKNLCTNCCSLLSSTLYSVSFLNLNCFLVPTLHWYSLPKLSNPSYSFMAFWTFEYLFLTFIFSFTLWFFLLLKNSF